MADVNASLFINFDNLDFELVANLYHIFDTFHAVFCEL